MSEIQPPSQSRSPGSLFRLPPELRVIIWELLIFNPTPRVCSLHYYRHAFETNPNLINTANGSDGIFVFDYPLLRYICRESRQEAIYHSASLGWQVSGQGHPKRRYQPEVDVLYGSYSFFKFLDESSKLTGQNVVNTPISIAAVQVREARHIAIPLGYNGLGVNSEDFEKLLRACPRLDKISSIIGNISMEETRDVMEHDFHAPNELPKRPCALGRIPVLGPISLDISEAGMLAYTRRYFMKRAYSRAEKASVKFTREADAVARRLNCQSLPPPQPAMLLQLTRRRFDGEHEKWEEVKVDGGWPLGKYRRARVVS